VKIEAVVKALFGERDEIFDGSRRVLLEEFEVDRAFAGFHDGLWHKYPFGSWVGS
jgi:hypothetical protein